jgi:WD40 repeat protein
MSSEGQTIGVEPPGNFGYPEVVALDRYTCAIADWTGHVSVWSLLSRSRLFQVDVGHPPLPGNRTLRCLRPSPISPSLVAVATRGGYAVVCDLEQGTKREVDPVSNGPVNSVAFSPDGNRLAIGLGFYPLGPHCHPAKVELWAWNEVEPRCLGTAAVPGVCVDALAWSPDSVEIAVISGMRSQKDGFLTRLDAADLHARTVAHVDWFDAGGAEFLNGIHQSGLLGVVRDKHFVAIETDDNSVEWERTGDDITAFAYDQENKRLLLSTGTIHNPWTGEDEGQISTPPRLTSIVARPGGGWVGVTEQNICFWD